MSQRVTENFFLGTYAFTIVTVDGKRFRAAVPGRKENAVSMIEAIRTLIPFGNSVLDSQTALPVLPAPGAPFIPAGPP